MVDVSNSGGDAWLQGRQGLLREEQGDRKGRGLNSIPVRFAMMTGIVCSLGFVLQYSLIMPHHVTPLSPTQMALLVLTLTLPAAVTYVAARKLAGMIGALRRSTLAILEGDIDSPVDVDCACEIGGLADSFRAMVARLNGNILRMNILAYTDSVTGLPNRAVINHVLDLASSKGPEACPGAMFFIDLDGFKRVNDTYGHDAGDELLRLASLRIVEDGFGVDRNEIDNCTTAFGELCDKCPTELVFVRFAGDEFIALLPGERGEAELVSIADNVIAAMATPFDVYGNEIRIGASIGIAVLGQAGEDPRDLLTHSDIAMYRAKENGRNCVAMFDLDLKEAVAERSDLEKDLRVAVENDDLTLKFQPKISALTGQLIGVEALARWEHPTKGWVPPDRFIPIAEQTGSMALLGDSVLRLAAAQAREWSHRRRRLPIAVNVSAVQFELPDFVSRLLSILEDAGVDPASLELEITETLAMSDYATTKRRLDALRAEGIRIAIDDFGTGYSNLSQLARLSFDSIKIDRSLIGGIGQNGKSEAMLDATINMAHALGHHVIAEGIETPRQLQLLSDLGCDQFQGYLIGGPMDAGELLEWEMDRGLAARPRPLLVRSIG